MTNMRLRRLEPDVITFNAAMSACEKTTQWLQALGMFADMRLRHVDSDVVACNAAICTCRKGTQWQGRARAAPWPR